MNTVVILEIVIGVLVLLGLVVFGVWGARRRRRTNLRQRFGPEYTREVRARGSERDAEQHLSQVADRRDRLDIRPLEPVARDRYTRRWEAVQGEFVDRPGGALDEADRLITEVMRDRGYPVEDFSERAELVAADHPQVVEHYRAAHASAAPITATPQRVGQCPDCGGAHRLLRSRSTSYPRDDLPADATFPPTADNPAW